MRLWHYELLPYLPDLQFKGQLRELVVIMRDWRDRGTTNHILINKVMEYPKTDLATYMLYYCGEYRLRYGVSVKEKILEEFFEFASVVGLFGYRPFKSWHTKEYLRSNMANLREKHFMGVGKSRISDEEWETLLRGYKDITGEEYVI